LASLDLETYAENVLINEIRGFLDAWAGLVQSGRPGRDRNDDGRAARREPVRGVTRPSPFIDDFPSLASVAQLKRCLDVTASRGPTWVVLLQTRIGDPLFVGLPLADGGGGPFGDVGGRVQHRLGGFWNLALQDIRHPDAEFVTEFDRHHVP
jgi:hypothetical protein